MIQQPPVRVNHRKSWEAGRGPRAQTSHVHGPHLAITSASSWALGINIISIIPSSCHHSGHGCLVLALKAGMLSRLRVDFGSVRKEMITPEDTEAIE